MKIKYLLIVIFLTIPLLDFASSAIGPDTATVLVKKDIVRKQNADFTHAIELLNGLLEDSEIAKDTFKTKEYVSKAHSLYNKVKTESRIVEILDFNKTQDLPVALHKNLSGLDYMVVFDSILFTPQGGFITSYMSLEVPQNGQRLAFRGAAIKFNKSGIAANARLELMEDFPIKMGEHTLLNLKSAQRKTFVSFDCKGFKSMGIQAELEFSRDLIVPEHTDGTLLPAPARVRAQFEVLQMREWGEIIAKINIPAFQIRGINGFGIQISDATIDLSETANAAGLIFPKSYQSSSASSPSEPMWQGVYIRQASISAPAQFQSTDNKRLTFFATNLLIDELGVSGQFGVKNLLSLDKGTMDSWKFSVDSLYVTMAMNQLVGGGLGGKLVVPMLGEDPLNYLAAINIGGNYLFNISTTGKKKIPLWAAEAEIQEGSGVEIKVVENKFLPRVYLNGKLSVGAGDAKLADISFEQLQLQTVVPYIKVGAIAFSSEKKQQKLSDFPITIKKIGVVSKDNDTGLDLTVAVNFVGEGEKSFGGEGSFTIWGEYKKVENRPQVKFKTVEIQEIKIDIDGGAFKLKGAIAVYKQHPVFGKGFKGAIQATFTPGLQVAASVQFGTVNDYRYWYADALAVLPQGILVAPGFGLYGFGGGAYYHMKRQVLKPVALPTDSNKNPSNETNEIGKSISGIQYLPDNTKGLGIKATVVVGTFPSPEPFNADATFEITFNTNSGIDYIGFGGDAYFMTAIDKRSAQAPVYATLKLDYDVPNKSIFGNLTVFMNLAGGMVRGLQPGNKAGSATVYFSPGDWYIHIGTPETRIGIKLMNIFDANSYLMVGTKMPGMPEVPANVKGILNQDMNFMRDENALKSGGGFAFGASVTMSTGNLSFLIFYARLDAGAGFDIMLKNYGKGVRCAGSSEPLGINGWYASGQAYAYVQGKIGIRVDVTFIKGDYDIIKLGAAAVLQAKLPNPFWMQGTVGGYYSILGGLISGQCKFQMTLGEQCKIVGGSAVSGIKIIAETSPAANEKNVNVFNAPQAAFNIPIYKVFELVDTDDQKKSFRAALDYFKASEAGTDITGKLIWNANKDVVVFESFEILPPKKTIKLLLKVHFEELKSGVWQPVMVNGKMVQETAESAFETGTAPEFIPENNVLYSYPCLRQFNFHKDETKQGYIQLLRGQTYLFAPGAQWKQIGRFQQAEQKREFDFQYSSADRLISYALPTGLSNDKVYTYQLLNIPTVTNARLDANVKSVVQGASDAKITTKDVEGTLSLLQEKPLLSSYVKTSRFSTFKAKMQALQHSPGWIWDIFTGVNELGTNLTSSEYFDKYDIQGTPNSDALIQFEAILDNKWYTKEVYPLMYQQYPLAGKYYVQWRKTDALGLPPVKAIYLRQSPKESILTAQDIATNGATPLSNYAAFVYNLSYITYKDYQELRQHAAIAFAAGNTSAAVSNLVASYYPILGNGKYRFKIRYVLPGSSQSTSETEFAIVKP